MGYSTSFQDMIANLKAQHAEALAAKDAEIQKLNFALHMAAQDLEELSQWGLACGLCALPLPPEARRSKPTTRLVICEECYTSMGNEECLCQGDHCRAPEAHQSAAAANFHKQYERGVS